MTNCFTIVLVVQRTIDHLQGELHQAFGHAIGESAPTGSPPVHSPDRPADAGAGHPATAEPSGRSLDLVFGDYEHLAARKARIRQNDPGEQSAYKVLLAEADRAMTVEHVSVAHKKRVAPSGDKHDYLSLAPYWWPDPDKKDGLPWIRRDGRVNPQTRGEHVDYDSKQRLFRRVETLCMAGLYSGDLKYAEKAVEQLEVLFVNPATLMNPNLNHAQGVPARNDGRCFGIIEWCDLSQLITPIQLLRAGDMFSETSNKAVTTWFEAYAKWLQTSEFGKEERDTRNNHGTWYDVQLAGILLFLGRKSEAREVLEQVKTRRIATQIEPDGRQPHELARTKSMSYSRMLRPEPTTPDRTSCSCPPMTSASTGSAPPSNSTIWTGIPVRPTTSRRRTPRSTGSSSRCLKSTRVDVN